MNDLLRKHYIQKKKYIIAYIVIVTFISAFFSFSSNSTIVRSSSDDTTNQINTTLMDNLETYAGVYSVTIANAVNPTATLSVLATLGAIENYDQYFDSNKTMDNMASFLSNLPFLRTAKRLPIANPYAAGILIFLTIGIYVMRSFKASKAVSQVSIDKIENVYGFVTSVLLTLLPIASSTVVAAELLSKNHEIIVSPFTYVITFIIAILSAIFSGILFICINTSVDALELLATILPIPHANLVVSIGRAILHGILVVLLIFSPILSVIFSLIIMILGIIGFKYAYLLTTYYNFIYVKPLFNKIFSSTKIHPLINRKCPNRLKKKFEHIDVAIPAFTMKKIGKINKRSLLWFVVSDQSLYAVYLKPLRKPQIFDIKALSPATPANTLYIHKTFRFMEILTEDKSIHFIISNVYANQFDTIRELTGFGDYQIIVDADPNSMDKKIERLKFWKKPKM